MRNEFEELKNIDEVPKNVNDKIDDTLNTLFAHSNQVEKGQDEKSQIENILVEMVKGNRQNKNNEENRRVSGRKINKWLCATVSAATCMLCIGLFNYDSLAATVKSFYNYVYGEGKVEVSETNNDTIYFSDEAVNLKENSNLEFVYWDNEKLVLVGTSDIFDHIYLEEDERFEYDEKMSATYGRGENAVHKEVYRTDLKPGTELDLEIYGKNRKFNLEEQNLYGKDEAGSMYCSEDSKLEVFPMGNRGKVFYFKKNDVEFENYQSMDLITLMDGDKEIDEESYLNIDDFIFIYDDNVKLDRVEMDSIYEVRFLENMQRRGVTFDLPIPAPGEEIIVDKDVLLGEHDGIKEMAHVYKVAWIDDAYKVYITNDWVRKYNYSGIISLDLIIDQDEKDPIASIDGGNWTKINGENYVVKEVKLNPEKFKEYSEKNDTIKLSCDWINVCIIDYIELNKQ